MNQIKRPITILSVGFVLLWNSGFIAAEYGLPYTGPYTLLFWRYFALTLLLFMYLIARGRFRWEGWKVAGTNMLIGILAHGVWLICVLLALDKDVPAGIVALLVSLQPLTTGAFSWLVTGERTHLFQWLGLIVGFLGVVVTVSFRIDPGDNQSLFGYLIPLGSVAGITMASLIQRKMEIRNKNSKLPVDITLFYQSLGTVLVFIFPAFVLENFATEWKTSFILTLTWLTVAVSAGAYTLMWMLIERIKATRVASLFYLGPPVTMLMGWIAFGDTVEAMDITGLAIVLGGVLLTQLKTRKKNQ
jgi:drug/metabolite transporter (DMT)-like permease